MLLDIHDLGHGIEANRVGWCNDERSKRRIKG
jgi:hypothetical protein